VDTPGSDLTGVRVIDAHTHLFPDAVRNDRRPYLARDAWFGSLYAADSVVLVSPEDMIASMDAAGVERSIVCGWPWRDMGLCREQNDFLASVGHQFPDRISWLAIVNPLDDAAATEIERAVDLGAVGIGELNADAQGFEWQQAHALAAAVEAAMAHDLPFLVHASEPAGHAYPGKGTATPDKLLQFIGAWPDLSIVAAHWGGGLPFYELMPEVRQMCRNVVYDTAASTYLYGWDVFPIVEQLIGPEKIVFGTDYPLLKQGNFLRRTLGSGVPETALPAVLASNADRVFGIGVAEGAA
jgi:predicted TIM-barrel fold metal-dependent hydrolase